MTPDMVPWVVARASGFAAVALLAGAMLAGLLVRTRTPVGSLRGGGLVDLHRHLSLLALLATGVHGAALVLDTTVEITPLALVVPGLVPYRPLATALGVLAAEAALIVHLSFRWRARIGARGWRRLHWLVYAAFAGALVHGVQAGTDSGSPWALALYGAAAGAVCGTTGWRAVTARRAPGGRARTAPTRQTRPMGDTSPSVGEEARA